MLFVSTGNEGTPVAGWLGSRGLSAHVLEYRTLPSGSDHELGMRFETGFADGSLQRDIAGHIEVAAADVADAVRWARERHDKVVVLGFSAGAIATMGAILMFGLEVDAVAAIYLPQFPALPVPAGAPPLFIAAAVDDQLGAFLDALLANCGLHGDRLVLGGFSQGAMLTCDLTLRDERPLAGLVLLSGTVLCQDEWFPVLARRKGLPVFQSHSPDDPVLPFTLAERLHEALRSAGADARFVRFAGGHGVGQPVLDALGAYLQEILP